MFFFYINMFFAGVLIPAKVPGDDLRYCPDNRLPGIRESAREREGLLPFG